jgi:urease accessory protein
MTVRTCVTSTDRTIHLHLFLHARSLLSSAVRLNLIGPYASAQLLLHPLRIVIERESSRHLNSTTGVIATFPSHGGIPDAGNGTTTSASEHDWSWADDDDGPAMTWPLGELLMGRHDMQHTRIFNS